MTRKITFMQNSEGLVVGAVATGFDLAEDTHAIDASMFAELADGIKDGNRVFVFADDDIDVAFV